ncbi:type II toxin-antitoxin system PemK/MazF family toxin [Azospirillum agricola]|uniref:type II toxin-antitoxin system PemK/MazF family toxin n=1 Tax=Azospirillum agricola TaxID=1720247 RepID=UPI000A0F32DA|nr:type II toxin-antitoxin system PemK/MazF family toxin [Azospirillum agricola]SMH38348.1 mRNA interferase MazF [Azospirillum lipoferum]
MKRGEIWTVAGGGGPYSGKPRPCVIVQSDLFDATTSITVCLLTGEDADAPLLRPKIEPASENGLREASWVEVDKIVTTRRANLGKRIGVLTDRNMAAIGTAMLVFLGIA